MQHSFGLLGLSVATALTAGVALADQVIESKEFPYDLAPGENVSESLACSSGALISGGVNVDGTLVDIRVVESYPTINGAEHHWRAGVVNTGQIQRTGTWDIIIMCETMSAVGTMVPAGDLWISRVTHQAPDANGNMTDVTNIFTVQADGSGLTQITTSPANQDWDNAAAAVSADGTQVVFETYRHRDDAMWGNASEIYVMAADGSGQTRLTANRGLLDDGPRWCGADWIVFSQEGVITKMRPYDMDGDMQGDDMSMVLDPGGDWDMNVDCTADGSKIVFSRDFGAGNQTIYTANFDGSGLTALTNTPGRNWTPRFSPDGQNIAFASSRNTNGTSGLNEIYVMDSADTDSDGLGDNLKRLTLDAATIVSDNAVWSPDGSHLAFGQYVNDTATIHTIDPHGFVVSAPILATPPNAWVSDWR